MSQSRLIIAREVPDEDTLGDLLERMARTTGVTATEVVKADFEAGRMVISVGYQNDLTPKALVSELWRRGFKAGLA